MSVKTVSLEKLEQTVKILERLAQHRRERPTTKSDEMYYDLFNKYVSRLCRAKDEGKFIAATVSWCRPNYSMLWIWSPSIWK